MQLLKKILDENNIEYVKPDGGSCVTVALPIEDDLQFFSDFAEKFDSAVNPGSFFGIPGHVRIAYLNMNENILIEGLKRFCSYCKELKEQKCKSCVGHEAHKSAEKSAPSHGSTTFGEAMSPPRMSFWEDWRTQLIEDDAKSDPSTYWTLMRLTSTSQYPY